ncbi:MAG: hypothetical protein ACRCWB_00835 [Enterovibrio sp.]
MGVNNVRGGIGPSNSNVTAEINSNPCVSQSALNDIKIISVHDSNIQPDSRSAASSSHRGSGIRRFFSNLRNYFSCYKRSSSLTLGNTADPVLSGQVNLAFDSQDGFISDRTRPPPSTSGGSQGARASQKSSGSPMPSEVGGSVRAGTARTSDLTGLSAASKQSSSVKKNAEIAPAMPHPSLPEYSADKTAQREPPTVTDLSLFMPPNGNNTDPSTTVGTEIEELDETPPPHPLTPTVVIINSTSATKGLGRMTSVECNEIDQHFAKRKAATASAAAAAANALVLSKSASAELISLLQNGSYGLIKVDIRQKEGVKLEPSKKAKVMLKKGRLVLEQISGKEGRWRLMETHGKRYPMASGLNAVKNETVLSVVAGRHSLTINGHTFVFEMDSDGVGTVKRAG